MLLVVPRALLAAGRESAGVARRAEAEAAARRAQQQLLQQLHRRQRQQRTGHRSGAHAQERAHLERGVEAAHEEHRPHRDAVRVSEFEPTQSTTTCM